MRIVEVKIVASIILGCMVTLGACQPYPSPVAERPSPTSTLVSLEAQEEVQLTQFVGMREGEITSQSGSASHPTWSPDGKRIAFALSEVLDGVERETLWVVKSDGSEAQRILVGPGFSYIREPAWSPDGEWLSFYLGGAEGIDLWAVRDDGSGLSRLLTSDDPDTIYSLSPSWSPDGQSIAYTQEIIEPRPEGHGFMVHSTIWIMRRDGSDPRPLTEGREPSWSPDGSELALVRDGEELDALPEIFLLSLETGEERSLGPGREPAWSPDGEWIAFVNRALTEYVIRQDAKGEPVVTVRHEPLEIWVMRLDGSQRTPLTRHPLSLEEAEGMAASISPSEGPIILQSDGDFSDWSPAWSPDGTRIAFFRQIAERAESNIWLLRLSFAR